MQLKFEKSEKYMENSFFSKLQMVHRDSKVSYDDSNTGKDFLVQKLP